MCGLDLISARRNLSLSRLWSRCLLLWAYNNLVSNLLPVIHPSIRCTYDTPYPRWYPYIVSFHLGLYVQLSSNASFRTLNWVFISRSLTFYRLRTAPDLTQHQYVRSWSQPVIVPAARSLDSIVLFPLITSSCVHEPTTDSSFDHGQKV